MAASQTLTIFGPNLNRAGQDKGQMHVHAEGCADCKHYGPGTKFGGGAGWTLNAGSREEVVCEIYGDMLDENPGAHWSEYDDLYFAPCVTIDHEAADGEPDIEESTMTTNTDMPAPVALHTAPSGKVTKWGAPGTDQVFRSKSDAQSFINGLAAYEAAKDESPSDDLDRRWAAAYAAAQGRVDAAKTVPTAPGQPTTDPAKAPLTTDKDDEPEAPVVKKGRVVTPPAAKVTVKVPKGIDVDAPKKSGFSRMIGDKPLGYIKEGPRVTVVEILASRLEGAAPADLKGTKSRGNLVALSVKTAEQAEQAAGLLTLARDNAVKVAKAAAA